MPPLRWRKPPGLRLAAPKGAAIFVLDNTFYNGGEMLRLFILLALQADPSADGIKALDAKDYPAAIAAFERAVTADPNSYAAHFHLGLSHSLAGNHAKAAESYRKTLALKPGLYEAELNLGVELIDLKQAGEAATFLRSAVEKKPKEFRPVYYLAEALLASTQFAQAEQQFRAALEVDAKATPAHAGLGRSLARQGKLKEAEASLRHAGDGDGLLELASLYEKAKDTNSAIAIYQNFQENPAVRERLGELYLEAGTPAEAIPHLEAAVRLSPTGANRYALATAYLRDKQNEKALAMMEQALEAEATNVELRIAYAGLLRDQRKFQASAEQFWKATQLKADSREAWSGLATMLLSLENYTQALAVFDRLEQLGETTPGVFYLRALALDHTKQYKPAKAAYQKFLSMSDNKHPDEEFKARQRIKVIDKELSKR